MLTPALRQELKRFGLKAIPRRKAIPLLKHIYQETHKSSEQNDHEVGLSSQNSDLSQSLSSSQESGEECLEETLFVAHEEEEVLPSTQSEKSKRLTGPELAKRIKEFIQKDKSLHTKVLLYEPIWLEDFFTAFKSEEQVKCTLAEVTDVLDAECVTFRTKASSKRNRRVEKSPRKKKRKRTQKD